MEKDDLFKNIIKNSGNNLLYKNALIKLHSKSSSLEKSINLRKELEFKIKKE